MLAEASYAVLASSPKKVLVTDLHIPRHDVTMAHRNTFQILKSLVTLGFSVTFLPLSTSGDEQYAKDVRDLGVTLDYEPMLHKSPEEYIRRFAKNFGTFLLQPLTFAETLLPVIYAVNPMARIIYYAQELAHLRTAREAEFYNSNDMRKRAKLVHGREVEIFQKVDLIVSTTDKEREVIKSERSVRRPVFTHTSLVPDSDATPAEYEARHDFILNGIFGKHPYLSGTLWFLENVWQLIRAREPKLEIHVCGAYPTPGLLRYDGMDGIRIESDPRSLNSLLSSCRLSVVPLLQVGDIEVRGRIAQAMGAGLPNICTSWGIENMTLEVGQDIVVADTPKLFAEAALRLYMDKELWQKVSIAGRKLMKDKYGERSGDEQLKRIFFEMAL